MDSSERIVDDADEVSRLEAALDAKYAGFRPDATVLPATTKARYATSTFLRFIPEGRILDVGELALQGRRVQLVDVAGNVIATATTDGDGTYAIADLGPASRSGGRFTVIRTAKSTVDSRSSAGVVAYV